MGNRVCVKVPEKWRSCRTYPWWLVGKTWKISWIFTFFVRNLFIVFGLILAGYEDTLWTHATKNTYLSRRWHSNFSMAARAPSTVAKSDDGRGEGGGPSALPQPRQHFPHSWGISATTNDAPHPSIRSGIRTMPTTSSRTTVVPKMTTTTTTTITTASRVTVPPPVSPMNNYASYITCVVAFWRRESARWQGHSRRKRMTAKFLTRSLYSLFSSLICLLADRDISWWKNPLLMQPLGKDSIASLCLMQRSTSEPSGAVIPPWACRLSRCQSFPLLSRNAAATCPHFF